MGRDTVPVCHKCCRQGRKLFLKGARCYTAKCPVEKRRSGVRRGKKPSDYAVHMKETQKVKQFYGVRDMQFKRLFAIAENMRGDSGVNLMVLLERRLDN